MRRRLRYRSSGLVWSARFSASRWRLAPLSASCGRSSPLVPDEAGEVVGEVDHPDLGACACDADRAHEEAHAGFLLREDISGRHLMSLRHAAARR